MTTSYLRSGIFLAPFHAMDENPTLSLQRDMELLELLDKLIPAGMACAAAYKVSDAVANPHTKARGAVLEVDYPGLGLVKSAANPIKLSDVSVQVRRKSPGIGEHTAEIMHEVGYSDAEIAALRDAKAVGMP